MIGDNDTLSAIVASTVHADLLVLLSDIDGLFTADPRKDPSATLIPTVCEITPEIKAMTSGAGTNLGTGGMTTKIQAAQIATENGIDMVIANGADPVILYDIADGKQAGRGTGCIRPGGADAGGSSGGHGEGHRGNDQIRSRKLDYNDCRIYRPVFHEFYPGS